jgi:predicted metal-binding protein
MNWENTSFTNRKSMTQPTLFICQSCCLSEDHSKDQPADGATLLEQVKTQLQTDTIKIQPVGCLWDCGRACVVAFSAPHKPTYVFSTIATESAPALLEFADRYVQSKTGNILHEQFPEQLQKVAIAKVPSVSQAAMEEE